MSVTSSAVRSLFCVSACITSTMSLAHYTDNPTECPRTLDSNLVAVDNWTYPTAHSRSMGPFGYLFEQASLTKVSNSLWRTDKQHVYRLSGHDGLILSRDEYLWWHYQSVSLRRTSRRRVCLEVFVGTVVVSLPSCREYGGRDMKRPGKRACQWSLLQVSVSVLV